MTLDEMKTYIPKFIKECIDISDGSLSRTITNKEIDKIFFNLPNTEKTKILEYLEREGYIKSKNKIQFIQKHIIKSFVLTEKALSYANES